jgi:hypothetical protein
VGSAKSAIVIFVQPTWFVRQPRDIAIVPIRALADRGALSGPPRRSRRTTGVSRSLLVRTDHRGRRRRSGGPLECPGRERGSRVVAVGDVFRLDGDPLQGHVLQDDRSTVELQAPALCGRRGLTACSLGAVLGAGQLTRGASGKLIDRIRHNIQERLDQLLAESEKLRHALAALDPRERPASEPKPAKSKPAAKRPVRKATSRKPIPARTPTRAASSANGSATSTRTAPGLARPTVSTTLSRLAKSGEAVKADRGYRLPSTGEGATAAEPAAEEAKTEA